MPTKDRKTLEAVLARFIWRKDDNNWAVALFEKDGMDTKVVGDVAHCVPGKSYKLEGFEEENNYGTSLKAISVVAIEPRGHDAVAAYLESLPGLGPTTAHALVRAFGADQVLDKLRTSSPDEIREAAKVRLSADKLQTAILAMDQESSALETELQVRKQLGNLATDKLVKRIMDKWGEKAPARIQANPWALATLPRMGFLKADAVALHLGVDTKSPERIKAAMRHVAGEIRNSGHTRLHQVQLSERCAELLDYGTDMDLRQLVADQLAVMVTEDELVGLPGDFVQLMSDHLCETEIAQLLKDRMERDVVPITLEQTQVQGFQLANDQQQAIALMRSLGERGTCLLTGAPGTGKTTMVQSFLPLFVDFATKLCAPTGKAARRLSEQAGRKATTIHVLLEPVPAGAQKDDVAKGRKEGELVFRFDRDEHNPLTASLVVVDEASMVDIYLFRALLRAIPEECYLLIVGDPNQLASVGPGAVLRDLLEADLPHARLHEIKRTNPGKLLECIHRVKDGKWRDIINRKEGDLFNMPASTEKDVVQTMASLYLDRLPKTLDEGMDPVLDIQMLLPWKSKDGLSARVVNEEVQRRRALKGAVQLQGKFPIGVGDKVINTRNNYDLGIVNGDMGLVQDLFKDGNGWAYSVQFQGYEKTHQVPAIGHDLDLAYAVTVHKSQGSEWPVVVLPAMGTRSPFYDRTLFYTGLSRAKRMGVLVGRQEGMGDVVQRMSAERRRTYLAQALTKGELSKAAKGFQGGSISSDTLRKAHGI